MGRPKGSKNRRSYSRKPSVKLYYYTNGDLDLLRVDTRKGTRLFRLEEIYSEELKLVP